MRWQIPGGVLERGKHIYAGLRREVLEETGLNVQPDGLTDAYQHLLAGIVALVVRTAPESGEPYPGTPSPCAGSTSTRHGG